MSTSGVALHASEAPFDVFYLRMLSLVLDLNDGDSVSFNVAADGKAPLI